MCMHPREYLPNNYLVPELLEAGVAVWTQAPRSIGNDIRLEHESALLDVAAGIQHLGKKGYEKVILVGMSGGASLFSFYVQQATMPDAERISRTPGGKPTQLQRAHLPLPDGVIFVAPHPGQGILLMNSIDPSVVDESNPKESDPSLNPFDPINGFEKPPESSRYTPEFVTRYRAAQRDRVARIDETARALIRTRMSARKHLKEKFAIETMVDASHTPILTIWRTDADIRCFDLSLEPTERAYGTLWGPNPFVSNYGSVGFGRLCTADSWLSTWSGISSNAAMAETARSITLPTLVIRYDADNSVFPSETQDIVDGIPADDISYEVVPGNHHGRPVREADPNGQEIAGDLMRQWVRDRFA